jgi:DNA-binding transcriptional MerR regulator
MSARKPDHQLSDISRKLDTLIRLSALGLVRDIKKQKEQVALLSNAGFPPKKIADILGTTRNTVSVALTAIRKEREKKERKVKASPKESTEATEAKTERALKTIWKNAETPAL